VKKIGVTEQTYYRWKKKYDGLRMDQAKRLKALETETLQSRVLAYSVLSRSALSVRSSPCSRFQRQ